MALKEPRRLDLARLLADHPNRWVALDDSMDKVVATGETFRKAAENAEVTGHASAVVIWSPPTLEGFQL